MAFFAILQVLIIQGVFEYVGRLAKKMLYSEIHKKMRWRQNWKSGNHEKYSHT